MVHGEAKEQIDRRMAGKQQHLPPPCFNVEHTPLPILRECIWLYAGNNLENFYREKKNYTKKKQQYSIITSPPH
jgi:hypothetical protein